MPFGPLKRNFVRSAIEDLHMNQNGCYGLFNNSACVYVGRGDIRQRLLDHLNGDNACITRNRPTYWMDTVTSDQVEEEKRLITAYKPICNQKVG